MSARLLVLYPQTCSGCANAMCRAMHVDSGHGCEHWRSTEKVIPLDLITQYVGSSTDGGDR